MVGCVLSVLLLLLRNSSLVLYKSVNFGEI